jgi:pimeloyl-ACP methyl ester carboxylesterase
MPDPGNMGTSSANRVRLPDDRTLGYAEFGNPGGQPVIYLHGLPASRLEARIAESAALRLELRLISPDRPGIGLSDFQPERTLAAWAEDIGHLADALGLDRFALLGVSGGGPYALACASRISRRLKAVGLVGALGPVTVPELRGAMKLPARFSFYLAAHWPRLTNLLYARTIGYILRLMPFFATLLLQPAKVDRPVLTRTDVGEIMGASIREAFRQGGRGPAKDLELLGGEWNFDLTRIGCPVFLWHGEQDRTVPVAMGRYLTGKIPGCQSRFPEKEGHFSLPIDHMDEILSMLAEGKKQNLKAELPP